MAEGCGSRGNNELGEANDWVANLNTMNAGSGFAGFTDWRLPTADPVCGFDYNCINSELGHLYYTELANPATGPMTNTVPFTRLLDILYWSGTDYAPDSSYAWNFHFVNGNQYTSNKNHTLNVWAVRPGARALPTPVGYNPQWLVITLASLMGAGGYILRRRAARQ